MFGSNNRDVPRLLDYAEAVAHEASIKPIRNRSPEIKPIGDRRNQHKIIRKNPDGSIACRLHRTDVVTFHPDGRIKVCWDGYVTQTTSSFISELLGTNITIQHTRAWISAQHNDGNTTPTSTITGSYAMHPTRPNVLRRGEPVDKTRPWIRPAPLHFENPLPVTTHRINRAGANRARKQYKAFKDYIVQTMRIRDEGFSAQEFGETFGWIDEERGVPRYPHSSQYTRQELLELAKSEQIQDHYKLSLILAWGTRKFSFSEGFFKQQLKTMLDKLDEYILREHRDECFDEVQVPAGEIQKDPYKKFF